MSQTLTSSGKSLTADSCDRILCSYTNVTSRIQIIRIANIQNLHLEQVIFPGQRLIFEAVPEAKLEIQVSEKNTLSVTCKQLQVIEITKVN